VKRRTKTSKAKQGARSGRSSKNRTTQESREPDDGRGDEDWELTPAQIREIKRRLADAKDPLRYLLVSQMGPRFCLYYNVCDDVYAMNDPEGGTLFKRREAAERIRATLGSGVRVVKCQTKRKGGARVPVRASLPRGIGR